MTESSLQLASRSAGGSFFALLCARPFGFAGHARSGSMRLRATLSQARRFVAEVRLSGVALTYVPAFAAERGCGRLLRVTNLPERVGARPSVLRATRVLGRRFAARVQTCRGRRWFVESLAATRGDLSRTLRADVGLLAGVAGRSTKCCARRFRNRRFSRRRSVLSHHSAAKNQDQVTANNGAAENRSGRLRAVTARASSSGAHSDSGGAPCGPPVGTRRASPPPPSAVSELGSFGDFAHLPCK